VRLKNQLKTYSVEGVTYENTGVYSIPVTNILKDEIRVVPVHPADVKRKNQKKTDVSDAWWLANLLRSGTIGKDKGIESSYLPDEEQSSLRILTRMQARYTAQATRHKNRITKIFDRTNIKIMTLFDDNNKFTKTSLVVYESLAEGKTWNEKITELQTIRETAKGNDKNVLTRQIKFLSENQNELDFYVENSVDKNLSENNRLELMFELVQLKQLNFFLDTLELKIKQIVSNNKLFEEQMNLLTSISGIGETTGPKILAEIPPISDFQSTKKFASFTGLVPSVKRSADVVHIGKITKRGSRYLRNVFVQSAKVASMSPKQRLGRKARILFDRKGKGKGKIVWTAIARKLAEISYAILRSKKTYEEEKFYKKTYKKVKTILNTKTVREIANQLRDRNYDVFIKDHSTNIAF
jgi:transposase